MAGIYFHIPFCRQACHYCDFHFSTTTDRLNEMIDAMIRELRLRQAYLGSEVIETIYFGGGTPSLLGLDQIDRFLSEIHRLFQVTQNPEITLEANPDDLSLDKLKALRSSGINRLSIGIQSFDDAVLKLLNRAHDSRSAVQSVSDSLRAGFNNISIDLIFSIPGQSMEMWKSNITRALELKPHHISSYSLTIEDKTAFGKWYKAGRLTPIPDDDAALQMEILVDTLGDRGYEQYEVSNFSLPGYESQHNTSYWEGKKYLGVGPSAHSYDQHSRQFNISNNPLYINSINRGELPFTLEKLTRADHINEFLLTRLRTSKGVDMGELQASYNFDIRREHIDYLARLQRDGLALIDQESIVLTRRGKLLADRIASDLFISE